MYAKLPDTFFILIRHLNPWLQLFLWYIPWHLSKSFTYGVAQGMYYWGSALGWKERVCSFRGNMRRDRKLFLQTTSRKICKVVFGWHCNIIIKWNSDCETILYLKIANLCARTTWLHLRYNNIIDQSMANDYEFIAHFI